MKHIVTTFMMLCLVSFFASAQSTFAGGDGTEASPYQITTAKQLDAVRFHMDANFILMNDIDLKAAGYNVWLPLGKSEANPNKFEAAYTGTFDGNGHCIKNINIVFSGNYTGFFAVLAGTIKNLGVQGSVNQLSGNIAGLLVAYLGQASFPGVIENCYAIGHVESTGMSVGLIAGIATQAAGTIKNCYSGGTVVNKGNKFSGGICGRATKNNVNIINCYSTADVTGTEYVGGIMGYMWTVGTIYNTYSTGRIEGTNFVGGVAGKLWKGSTATAHLALNTAIVGQENVGRVFGEVDDNASCENVWGLKGMVVNMNGVGYSPENNVYAKDGGDLTELDNELSTAIDFYEGNLGWDFDTDWTQPEGGKGYPILKNIPVTTSIRQIEASKRVNNISTFFTGNLLHVVGINPGSSIKVYNSNGQLVKSSVNADNHSVYIIPQKGVYIVEVMGDTNYKAKILSR